MLNNIRWSIAASLAERAKTLMEVKTFEGVRKGLNWFELSLLIAPRDEIGCRIRKDLDENVKNIFIKELES